VSAVRAWQILARWAGRQQTSVPKLSAGPIHEQKRLGQVHGVPNRNVDEPPGCPPLLALPPWVRAPDWCITGVNLTPFHCRHFQPTEGHVSCYHCPSGKFQPEHNATECPGVCDQCEKGQYGATEGTASTNSTTCHCLECPEGKYTPKGQAMCHDCPAGRFIHEKGVAYCHYCPKGTYSNEGASICQSCEYEKYQPDQGSSACLNCPTGQYQHIMGSTECSGNASSKL
jgi:hypothetical protein